MTQDETITLYEKCKHCHLFIGFNSEYGGDNYDRDDIAEYDHLDRGDEADEAITSTHDAEPSGQLATLATWKEFGPPEMLARFDKTVRVTWSVTRTYSAVLDIPQDLTDHDGEFFTNLLAARETDLVANDIVVTVDTVIPAT